MGDANTGGLQGVQNEPLTGTSQQAPPPGAPPLPLPTTGPVTVTGPPPNYTDLGAGQAKADFAAASANGGWEFDPHAMDAVIKDLDDSLKFDYRRANAEATNLVGIDAMGHEVASEGYVEIANRSGASYQEFLRSAADYTTAYRDTLVQIRDAYVNQDQAALDALRDAGKAS
jgi:hypothetical protein